jgi:DNA-binding Xre family transcriptional regulator
MMQQVGISSFKGLSRKAGVSEWQVRQLRQGHIDQMRVESLRKLAHALEVSLTDLLSTFTTEAPTASAPLTPTAELAALQLEYQRSQTQLAEQREQLWQEFQQTTLQAIESWLTFWPAAAHAAQQPNAKVTVDTLLRLAKPLDQLLQQWGVEATAAVNVELPYDPTQHQLMDGTAQPGDRVRVRYPGYCQGEKLLYRAKVSPVSTSTKL